MNRNQFAEIVDAIAKNGGEREVEGSLLLLGVGERLVLDTAEVSQRVLVVLEVIAHCAVVVAGELVEARVHRRNTFDLVQLTVRLFNEFLKSSIFIESYSQLYITTSNKYFGLFEILLL